MVGSACGGDYDRPFFSGLSIYATSKSCAGWGDSRVETHKQTWSYAQAPDLNTNICVSQMPSAGPDPWQTTITDRQQGCHWCSRTTLSSFPT